jgi:hypothetical protein
MPTSLSQADPSVLLALPPEIRMEITKQLSPSARIKREQKVFTPSPTRKRAAKNTLDHYFAVRQQQQSPVKANTVENADEIIMDADVLMELPTQIRREVLEDYNYQKRSVNKRLCNQSPIKKQQLTKNNYKVNPQLDKSFRLVGKQRALASQFDYCKQLISQLTTTSTNNGTIASGTQQSQWQVIRLFARQLLDGCEYERLSDLLLLEQRLQSNFCTLNYNHNNNNNELNRIYEELLQDLRIRLGY